MKLFNVLSRHATILILSVTLVASLGAHESMFFSSQQTEDARLWGKLAPYWNALEGALSNAFNNTVNYVENLFSELESEFVQQPAPSPQFNYDLTLVGFVNFADGIGRHPILFKQCLNDRVNMNFLSTRNIPTEIEDAQLGLPRLDPTKQEDVGAVAILTDVLADESSNFSKKMPDSVVKMAYTMFESTELPYNWASILNKKFDAAIVPDQFFVDVYKRCGVQIPIFVLPLPLRLHEFLKVEQQQAPHEPFVFGMSAGFWGRKNHMRVLEAFAAEFGNSSDVKLRLHGRFGEQEIIDALAQKIAEYGLTNVELIVKSFDWDEYLEFFKSLDCYVFLSMGEGFSITPREALACGKPCILTDNTAQTTICNSGFVCPVSSDVLVPALYDCHGYGYNADYTKYFLSNNRGDLLTKFIQNDKEEDSDLVWRSARIGYQFDCTIDDARYAMRDMINYYNFYLMKAAMGREWVKQYLPEMLSDKYLNLVKPQSIVLGDDNVIGDDYLMTNSPDLYAKYCSILGG